MRVLQVEAISERSSGATYEGPAFSLHGVLNGSIQIEVKGGTNLVATAQLRVSNQIVPEGSLAARAAPTKWSNLGSAVALTTDGLYLIAAQSLAYRWGQLVFTFTSADQAGTIGAIVYGVGF
jgi:hypothetical protein